MPKETPQQRAERLAREEAAAQAALEAYYASVPKRLMEAQALANTIYVSTSVTLGPGGPIVHFEYESEKYKVFIDSTLTYQSEEWELESLESRLQELKEKIEDEKRRYKAAESVWATLSAGDRQYLKEFIHLLKIY